MLEKEPLSSKILYERVYAYRAPTISSEFEFLESHPRSKRSRYGILHRNPSIRRMEIPPTNNHRSSQQSYSLHKNRNSLCIISDQARITCRLGSSSISQRHTKTCTASAESFPKEEVMTIRALLIVSVMITLSTLALGQTSRGTVAGTVTDPNGAVVAGAEVTLTSVATKLTRTTISNGEGLYRFEAVDPGTYSVSVKATGFGEVVKTGVEVQANQTADVTAQLTVGGQVETVNVAADAGQLLQVEAPVRGGNIDKVKITELPVAGRNPVALALTLPGVSTNRFGFGVGTFSVNGSRGRSNNFLIDGTENNDISVAGQGFQITNPDAVQEVSVQTSNYDAEFGRAGGAVVNTITKSGSDDFHGSL